MKFLSCLLLIVLCGCATVPATKIQIPTARGPVLIDSPKETSWSNVKARFNSDGSFDFSIGGVKAENQVDVIQAVTSSNERMLSRGLDAAMEMIQSGAKGAGEAVVP
jgi:hypothetical protein